jgi:hypothetical protein
MGLSERSERKELVIEMSDVRESMMRRNKQCRPIGRDSACGR